MHAKDMSGSKCARWSVLRRDEDATSKNRQAYWVCSCDCGTVRSVAGWRLRSGLSKSCGCYAREVSVARNTGVFGDRHPRWKGGRTESRGYVRIVRNVDGLQKYQLEHRKVMEDNLGRELSESEEIHHINGVRNDNRVANLELRVSPHGSKIRVDDAIAWAKEILSRYECDVYPEEELCL